MAEASEIIVKGQEAPLLYAPDFKIPLYPHQAYAADWIDEKRSKSLIIEAPTGGGKTLAALASTIRTVEAKENAVAVFIYPTNELLKNQIASIHKSLKQLGFRPRVFGVFEQQKDENGFDVSIIEGTGEALHTLALLSTHRRQRTEIPSFGHIFSRLLEHEAKIKILATNPDVLYLLVSAKYGSAPRLITEAANADLFVVDEFHAYFGVSLANLLYTLKMIDLLGAKKKYLFLSATPSPELLDVVNQLFGPYEYVKLSDLLDKASREKLGLHYDEAGKRKISYDVTLRLLPAKSLDDLSLLNDVVRQTLDRYDLVKSNFKGEGVVPTVVIVNSVLDAVNIADTLEENGFKVSQIHGLIPKYHRKIVGDVIVGTSAIELGIDFQAYSVIFEGREASAFLQRFGRVGRHFLGEATAFVPERILEETWTSECSREWVADLVNAIFVKSVNYSEFVRSRQGMELLAAIALNLIDGLREVDENRVADASAKIIELANLVKNNLDVQGIDLNRLTLRGSARRLAEKPSQRGGAPSVIVFIENYGAALSLDIVDAFRKLENLEELEENSLRKIIDQKSLDIETKVLLLYGKKAGFKMFRSRDILRQKNKVVVASSYYGRCVKAASRENPLSIVINGQAQPESQQVLEGTLYCISNIYQDWRLNPVQLYEPEREQLFVILGANSLVSEWLASQSLV